MENNEQSFGDHTDKPTTPVTEDYILPCPFCGNRPEWIHLVHPSGVPGLHCSTCFITMKRDRHDKAISNWNHRVSQQPVREKTLDEVKDIIARKYGRKDWSEGASQFNYNASQNFVVDHWQEVALLYASTKAVETQQGWVDVNNELPGASLKDKNGEIYVLASEDNDCLCVEKVFFDEDGFFWIPFAGLKYGAKYWMPLPEPPTQTNN